MNRQTYLLYILSLSIGHPSRATIDSLMSLSEREGSLNAVSAQQISAELRLNRSQAQKFLDNCRVHTIKEFEETLKRFQVTAIDCLSDSYPVLLRQIPDAPLIIYCRGNLNLLRVATTLAIVGSRRATSYGKLAVQKLVGGLSGAEPCIVSGLAYGIDAEAHQAALQNNLSTIAVLGSGIDDDNIFPKENFRLAQDILQNNGLLLSEYAPGTPPQKFHFVARNRIIAGLSKVVLIAEAAQKSGALITADLALEYNRQVLAVPGSIFSLQSSGTHLLIYNGATITTDSSVILEELGIEPKPSNNRAEFSAVEQSVLKYMQTEQQSFEQLLEATQLSTTELQSALSTLELKAKITQIHPQFYQIIS